MTPDNCRELAEEISAWFSSQAERKIPPGMMCEAFIMLPLCSWLSERDYHLMAEHTEKSVIPYHAFDLRADGNNSVCLFDLKFFRTQKQIRWPAIEKDLRCLGHATAEATHRYCLVCVDQRGFSKDFEISSRIHALLDKDAMKSDVVCVGSAVSGRDGHYVTTLLRIAPA